VFELDLNAVRAFRPSRVLKQHEIWILPENVENILYVVEENTKTFLIVHPYLKK
jgi:hypothetical protein